MRLFQLTTNGRPYLRYFQAKTRNPGARSHGERLRELLDHRYGNSHLLRPVEDRSPSAFFAIADDEVLQCAWASENGLAKRTPPDEIVLAQIEAHRAEVLYNLSPLLYDSKFLRRLPGCVKRALCWRAAPVGRADLSGYDLCLCNFQGLLDEWARRGWKAAWFEPAHDPVASEYAHRDDRHIDIAFAGGYSWLHGRRNAFLQRIADLASRYAVRFHFSMARSARLVNALPPLRLLFPHLAIHGSLRRVTRGPVYGREMYQLFGAARIVVNAAIDMAEEYRGNMRCWEAMGCGAVMLSDEGIYPPGMKPGIDFETYRGTDEALAKIKSILSDYDAWKPMARRALTTMETTYSKEAQWASFVELVGRT